MLTALELGLLVLTVEFALLALGLGYWLRRGGRRVAQQQVVAVTTLVSKVEATEAARREALETIFRGTYNLDDAESARVVTDFIERERAFYNAMISVHVGRGGKTLGDVPAELTKVIAPWLRLTPKNMVSANALHELENANSMLNEELASTKRVLDELMEEYNAAFHKEQQRRAAGLAAEPGTVDEGLRLPGVDTVRVDDSGLAEPPEALTVLDNLPPSVLVEIPDDQGEIIALDIDLPGTDSGPVGAFESTQLTSTDLDLLMENLETEYQPASVAA